MFKKGEYVHDGKRLFRIVDVSYGAFMLENCVDQVIVRIPVSRIISRRGCR